jgi:hypothetical protein
MSNPKRDEERDQYDKDINDVFVMGIKSISEFQEPYRQMLIDGYRFSATKYNSGDENFVPTLMETLDII